MLIALIFYHRAYDAPVHAGVGNGGVNPLDVVGNDSNTPSWVKYQASEYGYATMRINAKQLDLIYYNNISESRHVASIRRNYPRQFSVV